MNQAAWFRMAQVGLALLALALVVDPPAGASAGAGVRLAIGLLCAAPLLALLGTSPRAGPRWGAWVAIVLVPYFALAVGGMLMMPADQRTLSVAFSGLVALVFLAGVAAARR
jgi:hypothetical protein